MIAAVAIVVRGQSALNAMPALLALAGHAEHAHAHAELRHRVRDVGREPLHLHVERQRVEHVRVLRLLECRMHSLLHKNVPRVLIPCMRS